MPAQRGDADAVADVAHPPWHTDWVASLRPRDGGTGPVGWQGTSSAFVVERSDGSALQVAVAGGLVVLFSGVLSNAAELQVGGTAADAASIVATRFGAKGDAAFAELRGPFAALVFEGARDRLVVARDQVGIEPIFYARHGRTWYWSGSPDALAAMPGISREPDAVALSEWLCGWFPAVEDTAYRAVKRVPQATVMTIAGDHADSRRYWEAWPESEPVEWLQDEELEGFEDLLARAVERTLTTGPAAIFLSGGVDSIAVAVEACEHANRTGAPVPLALSLTFPDAASNEAPVQTGVARQLGMAQQLVPLSDAAGSGGLVAGALALSVEWPQPLWNIWAPAYMELARRAAHAGKRVVLTGRGGDEWLTVSPYVLADLIGRGDLVGAWRFLQVRRRSNSLRGVGPAARLVWLAAGRPLASAALAAAAPGPWHARRQRRLLAERPSWVAPDPLIRRAMDERIDRWIEPARPPGGFYLREARLALRHPAVTHDLEETQELGRRHGLRMLHPFWDVDLIAMLIRVRPSRLSGDGRSKSMLRPRLAQRLPGLGLETRAKVSAGHVFRAAMARDSAAALERLGGPRTLAGIGAVGLDALESARRLQEVQAWGGPGRLWSLLTLETWTRRRHQA